MDKHSQITVTNINTAIKQLLLPVEILKHMDDYFLRWTFALTDQIGIPNHGIAISPYKSSPSKVTTHMTDKPASSRA